MAARIALLLLLATCGASASKGDSVRTILEAFLSAPSPAALPAAEPRPFRVIGAGFSRTGTTSITQALSILGFRTFDASTVMQTPGLVEQAAKAVRERPDVPSEFLSAIPRLGFDATMDAPMNALWKEQARHFPEAQILLSVRDNSSQWFDSFDSANTAFAPMESVPWSWLVNVGPLFKELDAAYGCVRGYRRVEFLWVSYLQRRDVDRDCMAAAYDRLIEDAQGEFGDRVLLFNARQGWEPLCRFLNLTTPLEPFPNSNSKTDILACYWLLRGGCVLYPTFPLLCAAVLAHIVRRCRSQRLGADHLKKVKKVK